MKRVVIVTANRYPCGDAGALRQHATAKIFKELGYSVVIAGYGEFTGKKMLVYDGIEYTSFRPNTQNKFVRLIYKALYGKRVLKFIQRNYPDVSVIFVVDMLPYAFKILSKYAKKKNIILVHDSVEWYSPEEFKRGEKDIGYQLKEQTNRKMVGKGWRVMAISTYLEDHFAKTTDRAVRVPVIMDIESIENNLDVLDTNKTTFAYVGSPLRKDYLKEIVEGFCLLRKEMLLDIELNIVGVNFQQLQDVCGISKETLDKLKGVLVAHGRLPHDEAVRYVREADYTLLIRDASLRYAKAGFPTKIVESLACGTPPVCNLSSDLAMYLKHGKNAILADGHAPEQIKIALESAILTTLEERTTLRRNARETAEKCFDYRQYISEMDKLLK